MGTEAEQTIPQWAADLRVSVAVIQGRTEQIPEIAQRLEELKANSVPMQEHVRLMNDVEELKARDIGARSDWDDVKSRVLEPRGTLGVLWEERVELRGSVRGLRWVVAIMGALLTVLGIFVALHDLGTSVRLGP